VMFLNFKAGILKTSDISIMEVKNLNNNFFNGRHLRTTPKFSEKIERIEKMQINLCYVSFIRITIHSSILNGLYRTQGIV
jgi:hypothetical protein